MKKYVFLLLVPVFIFPSCKRELSCEGCAANNKPPVAMAGPDTPITLPTDSVSLDGSASNDPDGKISAWQWTKITGPASFQITNAKTAKTIVKKLVVGVYQFELKVTDDEGASTKDTVMITVDSVATSNHPPIACAGADTIITLPYNTATLNGSCSTDPDNNITSYLWTKVAGPSSLTIANANAVTTQVSELTEGTYQFELKVTDAGGLFSKDTVQVTVQPAKQTEVCDISNRATITIQLTPIASIPFPRFVPTAATIGNKLLLAGGSLLGGGVPVSDVSIYDFQYAELVNRSP
jgi:hypothetical protein